MIDTISWPLLQSWAVAPYGVLAVAVLFGVLACTRAALAVLGVSCALALAAGVATPVGALLLLAFAGLAWLLRWPGISPAARSWLAFGIAACAVVFYAHLVPGFHNLKVVSGAKVSPDALPFHMSLNFDKVSAGLIVLLASRREECPLPAATRAFAVAALLAAAVLLVPFFAGLIRFDPKFPLPLAAFWIVNNLVFVCVAEEALFRLHLQTQMRDRIRDPRWKAPLAIAFSAVTFGALHFSGGLLLVVFAAIAGVGYAVAFEWSRRLSHSIALHFLLNLVHFTLFTYPGPMR